MAVSCRTWRNKSSKRRAEVELTSSPSVKSPCTTALQSLKALWLPPTISYWGKHLHCLHLPCHREPPLWENSSLLLPLPHQCLRSLLGPKKHSSPDHVESTPLDGTTPKATVGGPPSSKRQEVHPWFRTLKPSHAEAFSQDSGLVRGARREFFSKHSYSFMADGTCDLKNISTDGHECQPTGHFHP